MTHSFEPTADQRRTVQVLSGIGVPQDQIALILGVDPKTLRKTCREDLDRGMAEANTKVAQTLFTMATRGDNTAATIFWMKARAGWREKQEVVVAAMAPPEDSEAERIRQLHAVAFCLELSTRMGQPKPLIDAE